ncbi:MAG TPA: Clp protease N-terminal domain-containing protein [Gemmataceae bacterium]|nr:Clp protease N-terminal domain-containing protein [Gemmataceae bacterium]
MYERFTERARKVMQLANWAARYSNDEYLTTEHILLALIQEGSGVAANALRNLSISLEAVSLEFDKILPRSPHKLSRDSLPQSPCVKQIIAEAIVDAELLEHNYVGTEHLLLSLLRQKESVAAQVLMNLGVKLEDVRGEVLRLLGCEIPVEKSSDIPPYSTPLRPCVDRERIRSLERQLWNLRVLLGAASGAVASALIWSDKGIAIEGLILGGIIAGLGGRLLGALAGGIVGALLASVHLPHEGGGLVGALLGALVGFLIAEIGEPPDRRGFLDLWRRR